MAAHSRYPRKDGNKLHSAIGGNTGLVGFVGGMHGVHVVEYVPPVWFLVCEW